MSQVNAWKKKLLDNADSLFDRKSKKSAPTEEEITAPLYEAIGRLKMDIKWLEKKALNLPVEPRRSWIDSSDDLPVRRQCRRAGISRPFLYYTPKGSSDFDTMIETEIEEIYAENNEFGSPRVTRELQDNKFAVNEKRVARVMKESGLQAITPGPHTSKPHPEHDVEIERVDQVWSTDITYIRMPRAFSI